MKILYCIAGMWRCGVLESEILNMRDGQNLSETGLIIKAKRVFSLEAAQTQVLGSKGQAVVLNLVIYNNVIMNCNFIADLNEQSLFYKEIAGVVEKEGSREN